MKKVFLNFQVSKGAMNKFRGGVDAGHVENCHCVGGGNFTIIVNENVDVFELMDQKCKGEDWSCSRQK
ncbi:MAG: hypothetical protein K2L60_05925 [Bacteroides sp.]|nr:hypothetical protein [Bacteroides sp.]